MRKQLAEGVLGELAMAAIEAQPIGPARDLEAALWARRAVEADVEAVLVIFQPGTATPSRVDAHARLMVAIERAREAR